MIRRAHPVGGFSLVELMVAITIGAIVLAAVSSLFVSSKTTYSEQDRQAKMQENARFALQFLMRDLRHAGYYGCVDDITADSVNNTLNPGNFIFNAMSPLDGLDNAGAGVKWYPSDTVSLPTGIEANTDAILLRMAQVSGAVSIADPMPSSSAELKVTSVTGIAEGDIIMVSDCANADVMQVTAVQGASLKIQHNPGGSSAPGNSTQKLSKPYSPPAQVFKFINRIYYIRPNSSNIPSLYRQDNGAAAEEIVEGIEKMHITYGKDTDGDDIPNVFLKAGQAGMQTAEDWSRVRAIRIGLLARTISEEYGLKDTLSFTVNEEPIAAKNDRNRRQAYHVTVTLRNMM